MHGVPEEAGLGESNPLVNKRKLIIEGGDLMFTKIDSIIWSDSKYKTLSDDAKLLFIYIFSGPHRNMLGFYFLPVPYAAFDLGWSSERLIKGLDELSNKEFINYNTNTSTIFVKNFLKYNPLENPNQVKGAIKALDLLATNEIDIELVEYLKTVDKAFLEPLIKLLEKRYIKQEEVEVEVKEEGEEEVSPTTTIFSEIVHTFQDNGFGLITPTTRDLLVSYTEDYTEEWVLDALELAIKRNKRSIGYTEGILKSWKAEGKDDNASQTTGDKKPDAKNEPDWAERAGVQSF